VLSFGISGFLYRNAVFYYDRQTETFWSQMTGAAMAGPLTGKRLKWMPSEVTTWKAWREKHPETTVLKAPFPLRTYKRTNDGYVRYRATDRLMIPLKTTVPDTYPRKSNVTILVRGDDARCYPHPALEEGKNKDGDLTIVKEGISVRVLDKSGKELPTLFGFWFAFFEFYEGGTVWEPPELPAKPERVGDDGDR